jgi:copper(I)-binding protein
MASHQNIGADLIVEHAVIVQPTAGAQETTGFLTIWNGTREPASLAAIESEAFGKVSIRQTELVEGRSKAEAVSGIVPIPGHAELLMRPDGIHLTLGELKRNLDAFSGIDLVLVFDDGRRLTVAAKLIEPGTRLADHHHGEGDE